MLTRRTLLAGTAFLLSSGAGLRARTISHGMPWTPNAAAPPIQVTREGWFFFNPREAAAIEALVDRLIPPDPDTPGAKDAGVAVYIDRQLIGPYGSYRGYYMQPPFANGLPQQGMQSPLTPAMRYRQGLAALQKYVSGKFGGRATGDLAPDDLDQLLHGLSDGSLTLEGADGKAFFTELLKNTKEGFFADPIYGGNRDMVGWRMIGFPGARYDLRDWIDHHNEPYPLPPVSISGARPAAQR